MNFLFKACHPLNKVIFSLSRALSVVSIYFSFLKIPSSSVAQFHEPKLVIFYFFFFNEIFGINFVPKFYEGWERYPPLKTKGFDFII
jgi:hypothetical protein